MHLGAGDGRGGQGDQHPARQKLCGQGRRVGGKDCLVARLEVPGRRRYGAASEIGRLDPSECWNGPYATGSFPLYAEPVPTSAADIDPAKSPSVAMLVEAARTLKVRMGRPKERPRWL
jgi:hypothetical protein